MSDDHAPDGVIRLETKQQRSEREEQEYCDAVQAEAVAMLAKAIEMVKERRVAGIVVVFAWEDNHYGRLLPYRTSNMGLLVGSIATAHQALILSTLASDESEVSE